MPVSETMVLFSSYGYTEISGQFHYLEGRFLTLGKESTATFFKHFAILKTKKRLKRIVKHGCGHHNFGTCPCISDEQRKEVLNMKKICMSFLAAMSIAFMLVVPVSAENNNMNANDMNTNNVNARSYNTNAATNDNDTDWGWLGLIGLAGLAGLRRRTPERH